MKPFAAWLLGMVLVPFVALAQAPATNLNTITAVEVRGGTVTITGTQKANFTTFTMTDPPRLVIDISEATFSGVSDEIQVGNGTVTGIRTASYGSEASSIARVLIGYEREVEADIQATGNQLIVSVAGGAGPAVAQAQGAEQPQAGSSAAEAAAAAEAERQAQEQAAAEAAAAARAEREAQAQAAAAATRDAEAEARRQEEARAAAQRQQEEQARAEAERERQEEAARASAQAAADEQRRREEAARASAQAAAEEQQRREEAARSAAEERQAQQRAAAEEQARRKAEARADAEQRRAAQAAAAEERRAAARAAAEERRAQQEAAAEERRQRQAEARASRERRQPSVEPSRQGGASSDVTVSSRRKTLTLVGFQPQASASRVFVRTNEPVSYSVSEQGRVVVLELENTRVDSSNNTLPLDTSFFASPVLRVDPSASGRDVRITIQLRQGTPFQARQEGNVISLDFQRTGR
ncbi:AMIN domain-containing protein [Corallococcus macrosporus DSM 14697]|uniref:AMIN domain-containing protein n=2 Tax=Corallococcus macrosporus TaxID=35 RepID=A0A250JT69_9BACT|nr:AMIN domain-containing protein [Corallococcus macrosporus DSM 14697]